MKSRDGQSQRREAKRRQMREWKIARRCGAKHVSKSKCTRHLSFVAFLEVAMPKKCTPLRREAHFKVKMYKAHHARTTFGSWDVEKVHAVVARSTLRNQNAQNTPCSDNFWKLRCRKSARRCGAKHISKSKCLKHHVRTFGRSDVLSRGRRKGLSKVSKTWGFCCMSKNRWQAWDIWRGSAKMQFPWQAQYKRHVYQRC